MTDGIFDNLTNFRKFFRVKRGSISITAIFFERFRQYFSAFAITTSDHNFRANGRQSTAYGFTDATVTTCDQRYLAIQSKRFQQVASDGGR